MNYEMIIWAIVIVFILILFIIKLVTPQIVCREMFFGVRLPENLLGLEGCFISIPVIRPCLWKNASASPGV